MATALKILLIDSEKEALLVRSLLRDVKEIEFDLDTSSTEAEFRDKLAENTYDAVLANLSMDSAFATPDVIASVRKAAPKAAIVAISGIENSELTNAALKDGSADNFLIKDVWDGNRIALSILYARQQKLSAFQGVNAAETFLHALEVQIVNKIRKGELTLRAALNNFLSALEGYQEFGFKSSILLLARGRLFLGGAPNLPLSYNESIEGVEIGPQVGSCGTAAFTKQTIYVVDIETDILWVKWREAAKQHGLKACWSVPIFAPTNEVLGTFAMYYSTSRFPTSEERDLIHRAAVTASIIIRSSRYGD